MKSVFFLSALLVSSQVLAAEYLVKYKNPGAFATLTTLSYNNSIRVLDNHTVGRLVKVDIDARDEARTLATLMHNPQVEYVVPNFKLHSYTLPAPLQPMSLRTQWALDKVQAAKAWDRAGNKGNKNVLVAVIDTGVDYKHESLSQNVVSGYDFALNTDDPMDKTGFQNPGHGTHCAGVIGATGLVDNGTIGISPSVSIMPLRFLTEDGSGDLNNAIKAIDYAIAHNVQIISASWGAAVPRSTAAPLLEAVKRADDKGVIFVVAAGNDGQSSDTEEVYPANNGYPNSITVGASGTNDERPDWSNYGTANVHLASPGLNIISTLPGNQYGELSGTSMATPLVSGLVAFLKAQDASLTGAQIRAILQTTGAKVDIQTACNCRIDAFAAVDAVLSKKVTLVPSAASVNPGDALTFQVLYGQGPFKFTSNNPAAVTVDNTGAMKAVANGVAVISVTDANGKTASTLNINVVTKSDTGNGGGGGDTPTPPPDDGGGGGGLPTPPGGGGGGGDPSSCPIQDPQICQAICQAQPDLAFCKK